MNLKRLLCFLSLAVATPAAAQTFTINPIGSIYSWLYPTWNAKDWYFE